MKKKGIAVILVVILLLGLGYFAWYRYNMSRVNGVQPLMIMVEDTRYVCYSNTEEEPPDTPPDGVITQVNSKTDYPDANGEANFGTVGMRYWRIGNRILVESNQSYYVLSKLGHQE